MRSSQEARFKKTGSVEVSHGRPPLFDAEAIQRLKDAVEHGTAERETLTKREFVHLANEMAHELYKLRNKGILFTKIDHKTINTIVRDHDFVFSEGKVRPGARARSEACQRSAYALAALVNALFSTSARSAACMGNTDELSIALTDDKVEPLITTKKMKAEMNSHHKSVAKSNSKEDKGTYLRIHLFATTTANGRYHVPSIVLKGHGITQLEVLPVRSVRRMQRSRSEKLCADAGLCGHHAPFRMRILLPGA